MKMKGNWILRELSNESDELQRFWMNELYKCIIVYIYSLQKESNQGKLIKSECNDDKEILSDFCMISRLDTFYSKTYP